MLGMQNAGKCPPAPGCLRQGGDIQPTPKRDGSFALALHETGVSQTKAAKYIPEIVDDEM